MRKEAYLLDFVETPAQRNRPYIVACLALALVLVAGLVFELSRAQSALGVEQARSMDLAHRLGRDPEPVVPLSPDGERRLKRAQQVVAELGLPWNDLFAAIEHAGADGLGLLSLTPDAASHSVRISGEAATFDDVVAYVKRLSAEPVFEDVYLVSFQSVPRDGRTVIGFTVGGRWTVR